MTSLTLHSPKPGSALEATVGHQQNFLNSHDAGSCVDIGEVFDLYCGDFLKHPASASLLYLLVGDLEIKRSRNTGYRKVAVRRASSRFSRSRQ